MTEHWATKYIGKHYLLGGRGPWFYDCWGLIWLVYREEFKIELPTYPGITQAPLHSQAHIILENMVGDWSEVKGEPFDGCGVAMSQKHIFHHVGLFLKEDQRVLHAWKGTGVIASSYRELRVIRGIRNIKYYRHRLWPT